MSQVVEENSKHVLHWSYKGRSFSYPVTNTDFLWWVRALWREGKPQVTVGHTLLQRFTLIYSTTGIYRTLTDFLRAYCQPINPLWFPGGSKSNARIKRLEALGDKKGVATEHKRAEQRKKYASTPISKIPKKYGEIAQQILSGETVSPTPRAVHFTSSFASKNDSPTTARQKAVAFAKKRKLQIVTIPEGFKQGVNWFFALPSSNPPKVQFGSIKMATLPLGLIGLLFLLFIFGRKRKL